MSIHQRWSEDRPLARICRDLENNNSHSTWAPSSTWVPSLYMSSVTLHGFRRSTWVPSFYMGSVTVYMNTWVPWLHINSVTLHEFRHSIRVPSLYMGSITVSMSSVTPHKFRHSTWVPSLYMSSATLHGFRLCPEMTGLLWAAEKFRRVTFRTSHSALAYWEMILLE